MAGGQVTLWWGLGAFLVLLILFPVVQEARRTSVATLRRRQRATSGGFASLSQGITHFRWHGPQDDADAPVLVMVHGLTTSSYVWDAMIPGLVDAGARVLTYDLYGRGLSDRPRGRQDRYFFKRQIVDLLNSQGVTAPVTLVGYSLGGGIAAAFAAARPAQIANLILIAPAGFGDTPSRFAEFTRKTPILGTWANMVLGDAELRSKVGRGAPSVIPDIAARQLAEIGTQGLLRSVLSTRRFMLSEDLSSEHEAFAAFGLPVLAIWADGDRVVPLRGRDALAQANPGAQQVVIAQAGHSMVHTHPAQVTAPIIAFLSGAPTAGVETGA